MSAAGRGASNTTAMLCSFCRAEREFVAEGPGVTICEVCISRCSNIDSSNEPQVMCSFCGRAPRRSRMAFLARKIVLINDNGDARICSTCLSIAGQVLEHKRATASSQAK